VARIAATYRHVAQTSDETPNIACGMEWLDKGTYNYGPFHPPLARVAMAVGPYLYGLRSQGRPDRWQEGNAILHSGPRYATALTLARVGILPFFVLASTMVWLWGRRAVGETGALVAVFLFTNMPAVLAHAGLATTDMALTACVSAAAYAFLRWTEEPGAGRAAVLGVAVAAAVLAKFSALLFVPVTMLLIMAARWRAPRPRVRSLAVAALVAFVLVWGAYRFHVGRVTEPAAAFLAGVRLPASQLIDGVLQVKAHDTAGHAAYLLGGYSPRGWWYFFPVAMAVKTPLGFLLLALVGLGVVATWQARAAAFGSLGVLACCMPAHLNIGLRFVLALYPMLAIVAAAGAMHLLAARRAAVWAVAGGVVASGLVAWAGVSSLAAHPDYLAYFNEIARREPERFLVDSDLDWGQDMKRLARRLEELRVPYLHMAVMYTGDDTKLGLPRWDGLEPYQPVSGWVAISFTLLKTFGRHMAAERGRSDSAYGWLDAYQPVERVGRSILLYRIPPNSR
jgi:hypothetical protein